MQNKFPNFQILCESSPNSIFQHWFQLYNITITLLVQYVLDISCSANFWYPKFQRKDRGTVSHLFLYVISLSQRLFHTSLSGLALKKSDPFVVCVFSKLFFTTCVVINQYIKPIIALDFPYFLLTISSRSINGPAFV